MIKNYTTQHWKMHNVFILMLCILYCGHARGAQDCGTVSLEEQLEITTNENCVNEAVVDNATTNNIKNLIKNLRRLAYRLSGGGNTAAILEHVKQIIATLEKLEPCSEVSKMDVLDRAEVKAGFFALGEEFFTHGDYLRSKPLRKTFWICVDGATKALHWHEGTKQKIWHQMAWNGSKSFWAERIWAPVCSTSEKMVKLGGFLSSAGLLSYFVFGVNPYKRLKHIGARALHITPDRDGIMCLACNHREPNNLPLTNPADLINTTRSTTAQEKASAIIPFQ